MIRLWKHILPLVAVVIFASCSDEEAKVIPRGKMADIYVEMLMMDQWISSTPGVRMIADTSLVYEPILEKYGYDKMDYMHSVDYYMNDPERFSRILRSSVEKFDERLKYLNELKEQQARELAAAKKIERFLQNCTYEEYFPYMSEEADIHDSLTIELDSLLVYRIVPLETADTVYDGLEMIVKADTLSVCDTLPVLDSLVIDEPEIELPVLRDTLPMKKRNINTKLIWQERK